MYFLAYLTIQACFAFTIIAQFTSNPFDDCPKGWLYGGTLGCFYFNTNTLKVINNLFFMYALKFMLS